MSGFNMMSYCNGAGCNTVQPRPNPTKSAQLSSLANSGGQITFRVPFLDNYISQYLQSYALLDSPAFVGAPTAPTLANLDDDTNAIATTSFVQQVAYQTGGNVLKSPTFTGTIVTDPSSTLVIQGHLNLNAVASGQIYLNYDQNPVTVFPLKWQYLNQVTSDVQSQFAQQSQTSDAIYANVAILQQQELTNYGNIALLQNNDRVIQGEIDATYGNVVTNQTSINKLYGNVSILQTQTTGQTYLVAANQTAFAGNVAVVQNTVLGGNVTVVGNTVLQKPVYLNANMQANGQTVTPTQIGYLTHLTGDVQNQLSSLQTATTGQTYNSGLNTTTFVGNVTVSGTTTLTTTRVTAGMYLEGTVYGNGQPVTPTQIGYLTHLKSDVQTQLDSLTAATTSQTYTDSTQTTQFAGNLRITGVTTMSGNIEVGGPSAVVGGNLTVVGNTTLQQSVYLSGNVQANGQTVTPTQMGYLANLTGDVQTQLTTLTRNLTYQTFDSGSNATTWTGGNLQIDQSAAGGWVSHRLPNSNCQYGETNQSIAKTSSGQSNCALGGYALYNLASGTGSYNVAVGSAAQSDVVGGRAGTLSKLSNGSYNTGSGYSCLRNLSGVSSYNTGVGALSLPLATTASYNTGVGYAAGNASDATTVFTGSNNTFLGANATYAPAAAGASNSTAVGYGATITDSHQIMLGTSGETVYVPGLLSVPGTASIGRTVAPVSDASYTSVTISTGIQLNAFYVDYAQMGSRSWIGASALGLTGGFNLCIDNVPPRSAVSQDYSLMFLVDASGYINTLYIRFASTTNYIRVLLYSTGVPISSSAVYVQQWVDLIILSTNRTTTNPYLAYSTVNSLSQ
jgi:cytoskeletal protein CcmA (bactofilin family)